MSRYQHALKRLVDRVIAAVVLVILAPGFLVIAMMIRRKIGPGSPFFVQPRPGLHGRPIKVVKFRSMVDARDNDGNPLPDAERTPSFGWFLRRFSIDELPQLINVIRGEMSLVGPRPLLLEYLERYPAKYLRRHDVLPGITGWAQVHGRDFATFSERLDMDLWYVDHWSFALDLRILWKTVQMILLRPRIAPIDQTMDEVDDLGLHHASGTYASRSRERVVDPE